MIKTYNKNWLNVLGWFTFYICIYYSQEILGWPVVRIWGASPWGTGISGDLTSVLRAAECYKTSDASAYLAEGAGQCVYIYGNGLIWVLNSLGLSLVNTSMISAFFIGIISLSFAVVTSIIFRQSSSRVTRSVAVLSMISPPVALLLERANFDALIFGLVFLGAWGASRNKFLLAIVPILLAALMKFYALVSALVILFVKIPRRAKWIAYPLSALVGIEVAFEILARRPAVPVDIGGAFGAHSLGLWLNFTTDYLDLAFSLPQMQSLLVGYAALGIAVLITWRHLLKNGISLKSFDIQVRSGDLMEILAFVTGIAFLACYLLGTNYDYRLIFFIPFALRTILRIGSRVIETQLVVMLLLAMWLSYDSGVFGQVLGDLIIGFWAAIAAISFGVTAISHWDLLKVKWVRWANLKTALPASKRQ